VGAVIGSRAMAKETPAGDVNDDASDEFEGEGIEHDQYLVFTAKDQEFGIQAMRIREISAMVDITVVPKSPSYIEGILNLRGRLVSVVNFRKRFGFEPKDADEDTRIIIVEQTGFPIGIMVDSVEEVIRIPDERVQKLPESAVTAGGDEYLAGVGMLDDRLIVLLNVDRLLSRTEGGGVEESPKVNGKAEAPEPSAAQPAESVSTTEHLETHRERLSKGKN
jgi:purine-binding chemotaxis protein CheW